MVQHACSNGHAIYKDLGLSSAYDQWSCSPVTRITNKDNSRIPTQTSVPCAPIIQPEAIREGLHVKQANKQKKHGYSCPLSRYTELKFTDHQTAKIYSNHSVNFKDPSGIPVEQNMKSFLVVSQKIFLQHNFTERYFKKL